MIDAYLSSMQADDTCYTPTDQKKSEHNMRYFLKTPCERGESDSGEEGRPPSAHRYPESPEQEENSHACEQE